MVKSFSSLRNGRIISLDVCLIGWTAGGLGVIVWHSGMATPYQCITESV